MGYSRGFQGDRLKFTDDRIGPLQARAFRQGAVHNEIALILLRDKASWNVGEADVGQTHQAGVDPHHENRHSHQPADSFSVGVGGDLKEEIEHMEERSQHSVDQRCGQPAEKPANGKDGESHEPCQHTERQPAIARSGAGCRQASRQHPTHSGQHLGFRQPHHQQPTKQGYASGWQGSLRGSRLGVAGRLSLMATKEDHRHCW